MILGLSNTETYDAYRFKNIRRSVQYYYPNGSAPLLGILSLMDEEETNDPEYSHWEERMVEQKTLTEACGAHGGSGAGPFETTASGDKTATFTWTTDTSYKVSLDDATQFRFGHVVRIIATIAGVSKALKGIVTAVDLTTTPDHIDVRAINTVAGVVNAATDVDDEVLVIGSAFAQGTIDLSSECSTVPVKVTNYTQIFRSPFSFTGTSLKTPLVYDESGPYKDKAKKISVKHMIEMERAFLFGTRHVYVAGTTPGTAITADPTTGVGLPVYTTGGVLWYLEQWEAANSVYRGGTGAAAVTLDTDDNKRIIENTSGVITEKLLDAWLERLFRYTTNTSNEKLFLCGSGYLQVMNQMYRSKTVLNSDLPSTDTYGMNVVKQLTPFGTIYYKTHPLFSQNETLRYCALALDVRNLKYRPMAGRDTELLKGRQANDADYIKEEYLTEAGLEMWQPESCMFIKNVTDFTL
jgi:hypothetical protein